MLVTWTPCVTSCLLCHHFHPKLLRNGAVLSPVGMAVFACVMRLLFVEVELREEGCFLYSIHYFKAFCAPGSCSHAEAGLVSL